MTVPHATETATALPAALPVLSPVEENIETVTAVPFLCSVGGNASMRNIPIVLEVIAPFVSHYCWDSEGETLIFTVHSQSTCITHFGAPKTLCSLTSL